MRYILALIALTAAVVVWLRALLRKQKKKANIKGWVKDQDLDGDGTKYYNHKAGVLCKPDLVMDGGSVIEYKSREAGDKPIYSDVMQVAIQMMIMRADRAELRYKNKTFVFQRDDQVMQKAMQDAVYAIKKMKYHLMTDNAPEGAPTPRKCAVCVFYKQCTEAAVA